MLSANQIADFLNQLYLQNKMMKQPGFLHVDTNWWKLKYDKFIEIKRWLKIRKLKKIEIQES